MRLPSSSSWIADSISKLWSYVSGGGSGTILDKTYPVGALYFSVNSTSPATLLGGTWERIQDRFLLAAGSTYTAGATGGEASHTLTVAEIPSHNHPAGIYFKQSGYNFTAPSYSAIQIGYSNYDSGSAGTLARPGTATSNINISHIHVGNTGSNTPHNNLPPYLVVYVWKRTA